MESILTIALTVLLLSTNLLRGSYAVTSQQPEGLRHISLEEIRSKLVRYNFLLGIDKSVRTLLESVAQLYRNETDLIVGMLSRDVDNIDSWRGDFPWEKGDYTVGTDSSAPMAFFRRQPEDRKCLIPADFRSPLKAEPVRVRTMEKMVEFLNKRCFYFVSMDDKLTEAGYKREAILNNLYQVKTSSTSSNDDSVTPSSRKCDRISTPPRNAREFARNYLFRSKPVIIENAIAHWDAMHKWSNDFLRAGYGKNKVHIKLTPLGEFEGCDSAKLFENYETFKIPDGVRKKLSFPDLVVVRPAVGNMRFSEFLDLVENDDVAKANISAYLEYSSIREYFPNLEYDLDEMPFASDILKLSHLNMWLSNGHTLGKLHFDPFDNFLCQLRGNKRLTLFEPYRNHDLYEAHIQEAVLGYDRKSGKFRNQELLDSTSMVMSPVDILKPDFDRFPNYTRAVPLECFLNEGDVLYLPAFWWHEVQSYPNKNEHRNLAVNFWYQPFLTKEFPCPECKLDINVMYRDLLTKFSRNVRSKKKKSKADGNS